MPSVRSYRNRLEDIHRLQTELAEKSEHFQFLVKEVNRISEYNERLLRQVYDYISLQVTPAPVILQTNRVEVEQLKAKIQQLELKVRVYRNYILKTYGSTTDLEDAIDIIEIPACLKPFDAIEYAANAEIPN